MANLTEARHIPMRKMALRPILEQNPSIDVVIDLHRDGVAEGTRLVTNVDGKDMAKVMLFNGLSYSNLNGGYWLSL